MHCKNWDQQTPHSQDEENKSSHNQMQMVESVLNDMN